MRTVRVPLGGRSYDVHIGAGIAARLDELLPAAGLTDVTSFTLVIDRAVESTARAAAASLRRAGVPVHVLTLDVSENSKSPEVLDAVYDRLIADGVDRRGAIVAVGGGVIGDLAGYAAATYLRGVRWIGVPTTLLAAVDSAIGGKTAINHARGKNLIGAVHQPALVTIDRGAFATLPLRDFISGYGEMLKYGLALDGALYDELVDTAPERVSDAQIERCIVRKAAVVAADEQDRSGVREVLNFGHTIGHALEAVTGYGYYRHGEAVILGMRAALGISVARAHCAPDVAAKADAQLRAIPLPPFPAIDRAALLAAVRRDKKKAPDGSMRFVLLRAIGEAVTDDGVDVATIEAALRPLAA